MKIQNWQNNRNFTKYRIRTGTFHNQVISFNPNSRKYPVYVYSIIYQNCGKGWELEADNPLSSNVELPLEGDMVIQMGEQSFTIRPGEAFLLRAGYSWHLKTGPSGFCRKVAVVFSGTLREEILDTLFGDNFYFPVKSADKLNEKIDRMVSLFHNNDTGNTQVISQLSYCFLSELSSGIASPQLPQELRIAMDVIDTVKNTRMTAGEIAEDLHMSGERLSALFKKHLNITMRQYMIKVRMESAARMLRNTDKRIKDISIASGYNSEVNFIADFSRYHGMPPRKYRLKYQQEEGK